MDVVFLLHTTQDNAHRAEAVKRALERLVSALGPLGPQAVQVWFQRQSDPFLSQPFTIPGFTAATMFLLYHWSRLSPSPLQAPDLLICWLASYPTITADSLVFRFSPIPGLVSYRLCHPCFAILPTPGWPPILQSSALPTVPAE